MKKKICVVTGSRSDYGLLRWPMHAIQASGRLELQVMVTGTHVEKSFGETWRHLEADGFEITARLPMLEDDDSPAAVTRSMATGLSGASALLPELAPDMLLVLGDRFEIYAVVIAAAMAQIPVAHLCGGDLTEGAVDDGFRHGISKLSHVHFPSNPMAAKRLVAMGEQPDMVHMIGSTGLDYLRHLEFDDRDAVFERLGLTARDRNILVTYHPVTLTTDSGLVEARNLLTALGELGPDVGVVMTGSNADALGRTISEEARDFAGGRDNVVLHDNLGSQLFLNSLNQMDAMVGNSSSGLYEAPSFGIPTLNIGARQAGRLKGESVLDCGSSLEDIRAGLARVQAMDCRDCVNPYGDGRSSERLVNVVESLEIGPEMLQKKFYQVEA